MVTYDSRDMAWDYWCPLMAELFASNQLGITPEAEWRDWANGVAGIGYFGNSAVPDSRGFETWQDWAQQLVGIMDIEATP